MIRRPHTRRTRIYLLAESLVLIVFSAAALLAPGAPESRSEPLSTGFTFSQQQTAYLDVGYQNAYEA